MVYREANNQDEGDLETGTRVCTSCGERKSMQDFYFANGGKHRRRKCKTCVAESRSAAWLLDASKKERNTYLARRSHLKLKYGITPDDFDAMMSRQDGRCLICERKMTPPHIDHDHDTGRVRGLLCFTCNTAIGKLRDDPMLCLRAADYLNGEL